MRYFDADGHPVGDVMYIEGEEVAAPSAGAVTGRPRTHPHLAVRLHGVSHGVDLMRIVFEDGRRTQPDASIHDIRRRAMDGIAALPEEFKRLRNPEVYRVLLSDAMGRLKESMLENPDVR